MFSVLRGTRMLRAFVPVYLGGVGRLCRAGVSRLPAGGRLSRWWVGAAWVVGCLVGVVAGGGGLGLGVAILLMGFIPFLVGRFGCESSYVPPGWRGDRAIGGDSSDLAGSASLDGGRRSGYVRGAWAGRDRGR